MTSAINGYAGDRLGRPQRHPYTVHVFVAHGVTVSGAAYRSKLIPAEFFSSCFCRAIIQVGVASATGRPEFINYAGHLQFTAFAAGAVRCRARRRK
jgi:hypothetical protein